MCGREGEEERGVERDRLGGGGGGGRERGGERDCRRGRERKGERESV